MVLYLVIVSRKGGYDVHSAHKDEETAQQWAHCKAYDGTDVAIAKMDDTVYDVVIRSAE